MLFCSINIFSCSFLYFSDHLLHMRKVVLLGAPGVGKGTYANLIRQWWHCSYLSSGDLIRDQIRLKTHVGNISEPYVLQGQLIPDKYAFDLVHSEFKKLVLDNGILFDGFPRNLAQVSMLDRICEVDAALLFTLDEEILLEKISGRRVCPECGNNYNIANIQKPGVDMPPILPCKEGICDKCQRALIQRKDDSVEVARQRLIQYKTTINPILEAYETRRCLLSFEITSGKKHMWTKLQAFLKEKLKL